MAVSHGDIALSRHAFFYFFGLYAWGIFKKLVLWLLILTVAYTSYQLFKSTKVFGASDAELTQAFLEPLPRVGAGFAIFIGIYSLIRAVIATRSTHYSMTPKGIIIETGWWTRRTVIVDYAQIQKMTIVTNPFDRAFKARYIYLDLIGGSAGVALEAVNADAVADIQGKLSIAAPKTAPRLSNSKAPAKKAVANTRPPAKVQAQKTRSKKKPASKRTTPTKTQRAKKTQ